MNRCCRHSCLSCLICWVPLLCATAFVAGCGRSGPPVEYVEGVILFEGKPVADATVCFTPVTQGPDSVTLPAVGRSDAEGRFQLKALQGSQTVAEGTGIGTYIVTVSKQETPPLPESDLSADEVPLPPPEAFEIREVLPSIYQDVHKTPLRAEVRDGSNEFRFELVAPSTAEPVGKKVKRRS